MRVYTPTGRKSVALCDKHYDDPYIHVLLLGALAKSGFIVISTGAVTVSEDKWDQMRSDPQLSSLGFFMNRYEHSTRHLLQDAFARFSVMVRVQSDTVGDLMFVSVTVNAAWQIFMVCRLDIDYWRKVWEVLYWYSIGDDVVEQSLSAGVSFSLPLSHGYEANRDELINWVKAIA